MINLARITNCFRYIFVVVICFSLMGSRLGGADFYWASHSHADVGFASHDVHHDFIHSHAQDGTKCRRADELGSAQKCCQTHSHIPVDCAQVFALPNKSKAVQGPLIAALSAQMAISCFRFSEKNLIPEALNAINPTLISLRTVILLV